MVKKIQINMSDRLFYVLVVVGVMSLLGVGVYAYNSGASPSVMGHSVEELEGVCLSNGTNCAVADSSYVVCGWYDGKVCPVENEIPLLLTGYSSTQVKCCGQAGVEPTTCDPYDWTTYNTYCSATCPAHWECGDVAGSWQYDQRRRLEDCKIEYRTTTGVACSASCGGCVGFDSCSNGECFAGR